MYLLPCIWVIIQTSLYSLAIADQYQAPLKSDAGRDVPVHRIAIIGAGAAGSSAAYHLAQYANASNIDTPIDITIFDVNSRVGGRTTTINALDDPRYPTEVGASIFVAINAILYNATRDFNLDTKDRLSYSTGSVYDLGIWDGSDFVFQVANEEKDSGFKGRWQGWWDIATLLWKYGLSPIRTQRAAKNAVGQFLKMYDEYFPFQNLNIAVEQTSLTDYTGLSGEQTLASSGISEKFSREVIQASTRVNYAQNLGGIHGLETMVCMSIEGAMAVEGGNWQIFDEAVKRSSAKVNLETAVTFINKNEAGDGNGGYYITTNTTSSSQLFDTIILAAPYYQSNITFVPPLLKTPSKIDYVTLHVTLFTSPHRPSPSYFNLNSQADVPDTILTTLPPHISPDSNARGKDAVGPTKFWSFSTLRVLEPSFDPYPSYVSDEELVAASKVTSKEMGRQYLYKIFSPEPITAEFLSELFDFPLDHTTSFTTTSSITNSTSNSTYKSTFNSFSSSTTTTTSSSSSTSDDISSLPSSLISWSYTKTWQSYPYLPPKTSFDDFNLTDDGRLWYTSSMEAFISTMETSALSGRNVARLIIDGLERERERSEQRY